MKRLCFSTLVAALATMLATPALAITWTASTPSANGTSYTNSASQTLSVGNTDTITSSGITATVSAWSNTNQTGVVNETSVGTNANGLNYTLESAYLAYYSGSGFGVSNRDKTTSTSSGDYNEGNNPEHATDNQQRYDSMLFSFSGATNGVVLSSITTGWVSGDSDISVWAYTGGTTTSSNLTGKTYSSLGSGWTLVGSYNGGSGAGSISLGNTSISSSYWLIGAYAPVSGANCTACNDGNDYFKLLSVSGTAATCTSNPTAPGCTPGRVPEPTTLGLLGVGLLGLVRIRRRSM